jgi:hypothetical protein
MTQKRFEVLGLIFAVLACIAGYLALPPIQTWLFPQSTQTQSPITPVVAVVSTSVPFLTYTPYPTQLLQPTYTPYPTYTSQPPIVNSPTSVIVSDTVAGTVLDVGQSWQTDNLVLTLGDVKLQAQPDWSFCYVSLRFYLENNSAVDRMITVEESQFTITDNLGRTNLPHSISSYTYPCPPPNGDPFSQLVKPGGRFPRVGYWYVGVSVDVTNTSLDYLLVTVDDLSSFKGATWKIPIYH